MNKNYVLTESEIEDLQDGQCVWVEERSGPFRTSGISVVVRDGDCVKLVDLYGGYYEVSTQGWNMFLNREDVRVWALPASPSRAEMDSTPWHGSDVAWIGTAR